MKPTIFGDDKKAIFDTGRDLPSRTTVTATKAVADDSFCRVVADDAVTVPEFEGFERSAGTLTALRLKTVEPHDDPWVGDGIEPEGDDRRAVFWVVSARQPLFLQVGGAAVRLQEGDWVMFDDRVLHSVISEGTWVGIAFQLRSKSSVQRDEPVELDDFALA